MNQLSDAEKFQRALLAAFASAFEPFFSKQALENFISADYSPAEFQVHGLLTVIHELMVQLIVADSVLPDHDMLYTAVARRFKPAAGFNRFQQAQRVVQLITEFAELELDKTAPSPPAPGRGRPPGARSPQRLKLRKVVRQAMFDLAAAGENYSGGWKNLPRDGAGPRNDDELEARGPALAVEQ